MERVGRDGRAERRAVRVGHTGGGLAGIRDGLIPGDKVIVFPSDRVVAGVSVVSSR